MTNLRWIEITLLAGATAVAILNTFPARAMDCQTVKSFKEKHLEATFIEVTKPQFFFLEGIYAMNPATPPGLPKAEDAFVATEGHDEGGVIVFLHGGQVCDLMPVPQVVLELLKQVSGGDDL